MSDPRHQLGREGERLAERFLRKRGLKTIARRHATPVGELDLIMREGKTVVFVEVKFRRSEAFGSPRQAVDARKRRHIVFAARGFLAQRGLEERACRFDVVGVRLAHGGLNLVVEHIPGAFVAEG